MSPLPYCSAATALFQTLVAVFSAVCFVFHAAGFVELQDVPITDARLAIPHIFQSADLLSNPSTRSSSPDPNGFVPDPGSGTDIGAIGTRQATDINGAGDWAHAAASSRNYPASISQASLFNEPVTGKHQEIVPRKPHAAC